MKHESASEGHLLGLLPSVLITQYFPLDFHCKL